MAGVNQQDKLFILNEKRGLGGGIFLPPKIHFNTAILLSCICTSVNPSPLKPKQNLPFQRL